MTVGIYDIKLESDDTASPTTTVELMLAEEVIGRDAEKRPISRKMWKELRLPPFPPRQSQGAVEYAHKDPGSDLVWSQEDWSGGALAPFYRAEQPSKYSKANGLDARWEGVLTLGMKRNGPLDFLVRNGTAELGATTGWAAGTGVTATAPAGAARTGSYGFRLVTDGSRLNNDILFSQSLTNPTVYRSREITVIAAIRRTSGTSSSLLLDVYNGASIQGESSTVTSASYTYVSATVTMDAGATAVTIRFREQTNETGAHTFEVDDIYVIPTGGIVCGGTATDGDALYGIFGRFICKWDETNDVWNAVYVHATAAFTSIVQYEGTLLAAAGTDYVYSADGSTWTVSTLVTPGLLADFFAVSRDQIFKAIKSGASQGVYYASTLAAVQNGGGGWTAVANNNIGLADTSVTGLHSVGDTIAVGKEEGLHSYLRYYSDGAAGDVFLNITSEFTGSENVENFDRGKEWHGWLYLATARQGLFRFSPGQGKLDDISSLLFNPRVGSFGGRARAFAADQAQLWMLVDTPTADTSTTKTVWLCSLRDRGDDLALHTIDGGVTMGDINHLTVNGNYLWAFGRLYDSSASDYTAQIYRWDLPQKGIAPAFDTTPSINTTGWLEHSIVNWKMPDESKALIAVTIFCKGSVMDAQHTIVVKFGTNGAAASTTTLATFSSATDVQTAYFDTITTPESNALGRSVQLRVEENSDDTVSPELYAIVLHATLRPQRVKVWEYHFLVGAGVIAHTGLADAQYEATGGGKATVLSRLDTLEAQVYPIELTEDNDGDNAETTHRVHIVPGSVQRVGQDTMHEGLEIYRILLEDKTVA